MAERSDHHVHPLGATQPAAALRSTPASGEAKPRLLQDFHGGRPCYLVSEGDCDTPCWVWLGSTHVKGYPCRWIDKKRVTVHRELVGPLTTDQDAHHICGQRRCVNPDHIEILTKKEHARRHNGGSVALDDALELLAKHARLSPKAIAGMSGRSPRAVAQALFRAHRSGVVVRVNRGEYVLPEAA